MTDTVTPETVTAPRRRMPKRTAVAVAAGAAAIALGVGGFLTTTAAFTDSESVTGNIVKTATLTIGKSASQTIALEKLIPGQEVVQNDVLTFTNAGNVDFGYTITLKNVTGPAALQAWVPVKISAGGKTESGTLASPPKITGLSLAPGAAAVDVDVTIGLDANADNTVKDTAAGFDLVVDATQK